MFATTSSALSLYLDLLLPVFIFYLFFALDTEVRIFFFVVTPRSVASLSRRLAKGHEDEDEVSLFLFLLSFSNMNVVDFEIDIVDVNSPPRHFTSYKKWSLLLLFFLRHHTLSVVKKGVERG